MKQLILFYKLECKRIIKLIPHILAGAIALSLVAGAIAFCAGKMIYINKNDANVSIAYSLEDENRMTGMIVGMLTGSDSISSVCNFIQTTEKESAELLADHQIMAAITIPAGFMNSLMSGKNYSIQISLPVRLSIYSIILVELTKAVENILDSAQAGVYTLYDFYKEQNVLEYEKEANLALNSIYLTKALDRSSTFQTHTVSATGAVPVKEYYICTGVVMLILMLGTTFIHTLQSNSRITNLKLYQAGIGSRHIALSKILSVALALFIFLFGSVLLFILLNALNILSVTVHLTAALFNTAAVRLCAAGVIVFIISLTSGRTGGMLLLFIVAAVMCFISGCFVPELFLPDVLKEISNYLPSTHMLRLMTDMIQNQISVFHLLTALCSGICLYLFTVLSLYIRKGARLI